MMFTFEFHEGVGHRPVPRFSKDSIDNVVETQIEEKLDYLVVVLALKCCDILHAEADLGDAALRRPR